MLCRVIPPYATRALVITIFHPGNGDENIRDPESVHITFVGPNILTLATSVYRGGWEIEFEHRQPGA